MKITIKHQLLSLNQATPDYEVRHILIGTFNPECGEKVDYFYGRVKNFSWRLISKIFKDDFDICNYDDFQEKLRKHRIACFDIINEITFEEKLKDKILAGYSDSNIINNNVKRKYNTAFLIKLKEKFPNAVFYSTWGKGSQLKNWKDELEQLPNIVPLASPSPVARVPKGEKKFEFALRDWTAKIQARG